MDSRSRVRGPFASRALRTHLEFEAQRLDLDIEVRDPRADHSPDSCAVIEFVSTGDATEHHVTVDEGKARVALELHGRDEDDAAQPISLEGCDQPAAYVAGNQVTVLFKLDAIFEAPTNLDTDGDVDPDRVPALLFDALIPHALDLVAQNIESQRRDDARDRFARLKVDSWQSRYRRWENDLRYNESDLESACRRVERLAKACAELRQQIHAFDEHTRPELLAQAEEEFDQLTSMTPEPFRELEIVDNTLRLETVDITLEHDERTYELGSLSVEIRLTDFRIRIRPGTDNQRVEEYFHPHLSPDGVPCWGNVGPTVSQLVGERELAGLLPLIWRFLTSYNSRDPYLPIDRWDPDFDSDTEFRACFDDADAFFDCVGCSRQECPFHEDRFERCWNHIQECFRWQRCVDCGRCEHAEEARQELDNLPTDTNQEQTT
jgi:hypothetical protein